MTPTEPRKRDDDNDKPVPQGTAPELANPPGDPAGLPPTPENLTPTGAPVDERFASRPADDREKPPPQPEIPQPSHHFQLGGSEEGSAAQRRTTKSEAPQGEKENGDDDARPSKSKSKSAHKRRR